VGEKTVLIHSRILTVWLRFRCLERNFIETCLPRPNNARLNAVLLEYVIKTNSSGESEQFVLLVHGIRFFCDMSVCVRASCSEGKHGLPFSSCFIGKSQCVDIGITLLLICLFSHIFSRFLLYSACVSRVISTNEEAE